MDLLWRQNIQLSNAILHVHMTKHKWYTASRHGNIACDMESGSYGWDLVGR